MWLALWLLYTCLILAAGIYQSVFVAHSHWEFVKWVPSPDELYTAEFWLDVVANVILYVPFALLYLKYAAKASVTRSAGLKVMLLALLVSCSVEVYQVYSHNRRPAPLDIVSNVSGTLLGVRLWRTRGLRVNQPASG